MPEFDSRKSGASTGSRRGQSLALSLLALFTPLEKARAVEGDLLEQAPGRAWFWTHVVLTTLALGRRDLLRDFPTIFLLSFGVLELFWSLNGYAMGPVRQMLWSFLDTNDRTVVMFVTYMSWSLPAVLWGMLLMLCLGSFGARTILLLACLLAARIGYNAGAYYTIAPTLEVLLALLVVILPLLLGGFFIHHRQIPGQVA